MSSVHEGGCLCLDVRFKTTGDPVRTTVCHCTFCQRHTGSAYLVAPIFKRDAVEFSGIATQAYDHRSDGSGKRASLHARTREQAARELEVPPCVFATATHQRCIPSSDSSRR